MRTATFQHVYGRTRRQGSLRHAAQVGIRVPVNAIRIAFLVHSYGRFGGREIQTALLALELNKRGHLADVFHSGEKFPANMRRKLLEHYRSLPLGLMRVRQTIGLILELRKYDWIVNVGCEPILSLLLLSFYGRRTTFYANSPLEAEWSERITGMDYPKLSKTFTKTVRTFYGRIGEILVRFRPTYLACKTVVRLAEELSLRMYREVWAVSRFSAKQIESFYNLPAGTVFPLYHMVRQDLFELSDGMGDRQGGEYILAVGALVPEKKFDILLEAIAKLDSTVRVVIAGDGPERERLLAAARKYRINLTLRYAQTAQELAWLYTNALFVVQTSLYECFSMVPVEAALFGKPTIILNSRHTGDSELIVSGITGISFDGCDTSLLAAAMKVLLEDAEERAQLGANVHDIVLKKFTPDARVKAFVRALPIATSR